ncbi:hypothetical protein BB559_007276 [Furculomyces boomerangus]|uniref:Ribosome biogenesis regulatory protein n=1 Tax=Furculomyces boomerangus TaxID=61424 RepID=A0A2T9XY24_9FUNG|nr:hypothetical protein BB559_007276 [Furculomyces boomerangus]
MDVSEVLKKNEAKYKPVTVEKALPLNFDLGLMTVYDCNLFEKDFNKKKVLEKNLLKNTRDITQLLVNQLFGLPTETTDEGVMGTLPKPIESIPREKPVPKDKPLTRWEKFAKVKGIQKRKKTRMVYDESTGDLKPTWGYKGMNKKEESEWLIPIPANAGPDHDVRKDMENKRKERVEKNTKRRTRNMEEAAAGTAVGKNSKAFRKAQLKQTIILSKTSTASLGKFDKKLEGEPKIKRAKRKTESVTRSALEEREINKSILKKITGI